MSPSDAGAARCTKESEEESTMSYAFFVDDKPYTTMYRTLNAMEIKQVADVPLDWRLGHEIGRRFRDGAPLFLSDATPIDLSGAPKRFYAVPHAYASGTPIPTPDAGGRAARSALLDLIVKWRGLSKERVHPYGKLMFPFAQDAYAECANDLEAVELRICMKGTEHGDQA